MSQFEVPLEQIAPFIQPDYWNGAVVGRDALPTAQRGIPGPISLRRGMKAFHEYFMTHQSHVSINSFQTGHQFDPASYEPGSVFVLAADNVAAAQPVDRFDFSETAVPDSYHRPMPYIGTGAHDIIAMQHEDVYYSRRTWWGVIMANRKGQHSLMGMSAHAMEIKPGGIDYSSRIFMNLGAITIGKPFGARHLKEGDRNTYDRVMGMDQLAIGTPQKERKLSFSGVMRSLGFSQG